MKSLVRQVEDNLLIEILSGQIPSGTKLAAERLLANQYQVSRPVVHQAIIKLQEQGLLEIIPRQGVLVKDYTEDGKISLLNKIQSLDREKIEISLNEDMIDFMFENMKSMMMMQKSFESFEVDLLEDQGFFELLSQMAIRTENKVFKMLINEFKIGILNVSKYALNDHENIKGMYKFLELLSMKKHKEAIIMLEAVFSGIKRSWIGGLNESK